MAPTRIDSSAATHLAVCSCGWRGMTSRSREVAARMAIAHEAEQHPAERTTRRHRASAVQTPRMADPRA